MAKPPSTPEYQSSPRRRCRVSVFALCLLILWACLDGTVLFSLAGRLAEDPAHSTTLKQDGNDDDLPNVKMRETRQEMLGNFLAGTLVPLFHTGCLQDLFADSHPGQTLPSFAFDGRLSFISHSFTPLRC